MSTERPDDLVAVAADDRWIEQLLAGGHDRDDTLAVALADWSEETREPVEPAPVPTRRPEQAAARSWSRPRGARLVGLVASLGLIFSSGVGQAVAEDPAAPLRFVLDRGVSLGERLVGEAPHQVEGAPADGAVDGAETERGEGPATSRAEHGRPPLDSLRAPEVARRGQGPRPTRPSLIDPSPEVAGQSTEADGAETEQGVGSPAQTASPRPSAGPSAAPSAGPTPSAGPSAAAVPEPSPRPSGSATGSAPSAAPSPSRSPQQGLLPPSTGLGPIPVRPGLPLPILPSPTAEEPTPSATPEPSGEPSADPSADTSPSPPSASPSSSAPRDDGAPGS